MNDNVVIIESVSDIGKYAKFTLENGDEYYGKYGYFYHIAYTLIRGVTFPVKARVSNLGLEYFHVEAIFHNGLWVKVKPRGY